MTVLTDLVEKNIDKPWDWKKLSKNNNMTLEFIQSHLDKPWDWYEISDRDDINLEFIERFMTRLSWMRLLRKAVITLDFIEKHIDFFTDATSIGVDSTRPKRKISNFSKHNWINLTFNPNLTLDFIQKYIDQEWHWNILSENPIVTLNFVENNSMQAWNWTKLSKHKDLSPSFVERFSLSPWDWNYLGMHKNICKLHLKCFEHDLLSNNTWKQMSKFPCVTENDIEQYINKPWDWWELSSRLSIEFIEKYPEKPWDTFKLSRNPNLTPEFIQNYPKTWNWEVLSDHTFQIAEEAGVEISIPEPDISSTEKNSSKCIIS